MAREFNNDNSPQTFLRVNAEGYLYEKSKEPKEGFEEITLESGKKTYHKKYMSTEIGHLSYIGTKEVQFEGVKSPIKFLEIGIKGETGTDKLTFHLFKTNGNLDDYVKAFALVLPNIDFSKRISITPSRDKTDSGYLNRNLFINYPDDPRESNLIKSAHRYGKDGDVPPMEKSTNVDGSIKYDFGAQDVFIYKILNEQIERFQAFKGTNSTPTKDGETKQESPQPNVSTTTAPEQPKQEGGAEEDADDLPF